MALIFKKANEKDDIQAIYQHTIDVFSDSPDFEWSENALESEVQEGWELFGAYEQGEIVAAALYKVDGVKLLTKNTAIKMSYQGSGFSHDIKDYFEQVARNKKLKEIYHYCSIDNFRAYSLNESHDYTKTDNKLGPDGRVVEWVKKL